MLYPNCSETVIRLKYDDIDSLNNIELKLYKEILLDESGWDKPIEDYSQLRGDDEWKAHYFYQTVGNGLIAFAYWIGYDFDTDEPWHSEDIMYDHLEGKWNKIAEYLSYKFTEFEDYIDNYENNSIWDYK